jgi:hypothetical protein
MTGRDVVVDELAMLAGLYARAAEAATFATVEEEALSRGIGTGLLAAVAVASGMPPSDAVFGDLVAAGAAVAGQACERLLGDVP